MGYECLHAALVDVFRDDTERSPEESAHHALARLRTAGLPVPPRPEYSDRSEGPPFAPELADAPPHPAEPS